jgi:hypothetical protein
MAHQWLTARLYGTADALPAVPPVLPRLARYVRSADPGTCLFFVRGDEPAGPAVEVWLAAGPGTRRVVADLVRPEPGSPWRAAVEQDLTRPVRHPHESGRDVTDELAAVSSAFALAVLPHGGPGPDEAFELGVRHLRGIAGLLPEAARPGFLFQCWQSWSATLSPRRRAELAAEAQVRTSTVPPSGTGARGYLEQTRRVIRHQRPGTGLPEPYLIFHQAGATHARLGVPPGWGAAAALTVRNELTGATTATAAATATGGPA